MEESLFEENYPGKGKAFAKAFPLKLDCFLEVNAEFVRLINESLKPG